MALNKTYWDYDNADATDWAGYGVKVADKQIYANPNFTWGDLDYSFPTSFRKRSITRLRRSGSLLQACNSIPDTVIYNSMIYYSGSGAQGSFYKDNYYSSYYAGNEGYRPVIDIDTHDFAYKMTVSLFSNGNWITVNAVDFVNNYDSYGATVYGYINNYMSGSSGRRYAFCNYYVTADSQFSVHANMYGYRTSGEGSIELGGHVVSGALFYYNSSIYQLCATTASNYSNVTTPCNLYFPFEIPELNGESWNLEYDYDRVPAALMTGGTYTNHAVLVYSDQRVYMPLKHILKDIIVNSGLVLLDSEDNKWISMVDDNGLCQDKLVLLSSDEAKESSIYNTRTSDNNLDPSPAPSPSGDKIDDMNVNPLWAMSSDAGFARYFLMSNDQIGSLQTWLSDTTFPDGYDPYPYIISLLQFPLKLSPDYCMPRSPSGHIVIGGEDTGITASLISNEKAWKGLGTYNVPRENGNFLDYSPYTQYEVYIPCCGWVTCPDIIAGRKIAVKINYDLTTAAIIGNVYVTIDGKEMIVASKSGMMGRETIVSGDAAGVRSAQITSALLSAGTGALNVATGAMSGNAVAAVSGGYHVAAGLAQANIAANSSYARTVGSTGGRALLCQYDKCYLKICTTEADIPAGYSHTVGYICNKSGKVSDFRGYTVFDNFDVTGITGLTQRELMEVKRIMESGVYINSPPQ